MVCMQLQAYAAHQPAAPEPAQAAPETPTDQAGGMDAPQEQQQPKAAAPKPAPPNPRNASTYEPPDWSGVPEG